MIPGRITSTASGLCVVLALSCWMQGCSDDEGCTAPAVTSDAVRLTFNDGADYGPAWSPDGTVIAFVSDRGGTEQIWTVPATGGDGTQISDLPAETRLSLAVSWAPDSRSVAIVSTHSDGSDIWIQPITGGFPRLLYQGILSFGSWSPDGGEMTLTGWNGDLAAVLSVATGETRPIFGGLAPVWSSDSERIFLGGYGGIKYVHRTGGDVSPLGFTAVGGWQSPVGVTRANLLVFLAMSSGSFGGSEGIWIISTHGGDPTQVVYNTAIAQAALSPDGTAIAFAQYGSAGTHIWTVPITGGDSYALCPADGLDAEPTWSPDGSRLAFASTRSGNWDVWVANVPH